MSRSLMDMVSLPDNELPATSLTGVTGIHLFGGPADSGEAYVASDGVAGATSLGDQHRTTAFARSHGEAYGNASVTHQPFSKLLNPRQQEFLRVNNYELKYLPVYADQPDPTYVVDWVWEVRDVHGSSVAPAHKWLYTAIHSAMDPKVPEGDGPKTIELDGHIMNVRV